MTQRNPAAWAGVAVTMFLAFAGAEFWMATELASLRVEVQRLREDFNEFKHPPTRTMALETDDHLILGEVWKK